MEIVKDGEVERRVTFEEFARTGSLGTLTFQGERLVPGPGDRGQPEDVPLRLDRAVLRRGGRREAPRQQGVGPSSSWTGSGAGRPGQARRRGAAPRGAASTTPRPRSSGRRWSTRRTRTSGATALDGRFWVVLLLVFAALRPLLLHRFPWNLSTKACGKALNGRNFFLVWRIFNLHNVLSLTERI